MTDERRDEEYALRGERRDDGRGTSGTRRDDARATGGAGCDDEPFEWSDAVPEPRRRRRRPGASGGAADWFDVDDWTDADDRFAAAGGSAGAPRRQPAAAAALPQGPLPGASREPSGAGAADGRGPRPRRRMLSAGTALFAILLGFFLGGLLDVANIRKDVEARPYGALRSFQLGLIKPMAGLSGLIGAERLAAAVAGALGRGEAEHHRLSDVSDAAEPLWPRRVTIDRPLRLYVAGDSMNQVFGSSLINLAEDTGLIEARHDYHVSSGLSRPDYYNWPQRLVDQLVSFSPDAATVMFGANDGQDVSFEGRVLKVGTKEWKRVYSLRVAEAMEILTQGGRRVYWVGNPIMRDLDYRKRIAMMNRIFAAQAARHPGVTFISTWATMADSKGAYAEHLKDSGGDLALMRATDGIHLTRAGGDRLARLVLDVIERDWAMKGGVFPSPAAPPSPGAAP